jgi:hypothetical protein
VNGATELLVAEALERLEGRSAAFALAPMPASTASSTLAHAGSDTCSR